MSEAASGADGLDAEPSAAATRRKILIARGAILIAAMAAVYGDVLYNMVLHWKTVDDYSHGFVVVPLAIYFAWERKYLLKKVPIDGSWWGLLPLVLGVAALAIGRLGVELTSMRVGFVLTLIGLVLLLYGRRVFEILAFPLFFLFLMVPLPQSLVNVIAFPLQLFAASSAVAVLHWLGIPVLLEGNIIHMANAELFVADACSGLRSLMALVTLGVVFAYFFRKSTPERIIIVASAIPIAIVVNSIRVGITGLLTHYVGQDAATGVIHEFQGLITFSVAFLLLLVEARLLAVAWPHVMSFFGPSQRAA